MASRRITAVAAILSVLVLTSTPAWADPPRPTNYLSRVTGLEPEVAGVSMEVVGGDAFLRISVEPGHTATVFGYGRGGEDEEPYLRIDSDGSVLANVNSPAHWLNQDRYAAVEVPASADVEAEPSWQPVGSEGTYAWHDHRIHWMSPDLPRPVARNPDERTVVTEWTVPIEVDETGVAVRGELVWLPSPSPIVPAMLVLVVAAAGLLAWRRLGIAAGAAAALGAGLLETLVAAGALAAAPADPPAIVTAVAPPLLGALVGGYSLLRRDPRQQARLVAIAAALVLLWAVPRLFVTVKPIIPSLLPDALVWVGVAASAGLGLAAAAVAVVVLVRGRTAALS